MAVQTYNDLEIYQSSHDLTIETHKLSLSLPKTERLLYSYINPKDIRVS